MAAGQQDVATNDVVARYHFAGCAQLAVNPNFANLKKVFAAPSSQVFMDLALDRLSGALAQSLGLRTNSDADPLTRPLLDDLIAAESMAGFGASPASPLGFVLAIRLDDARAALWQANIGREFGSAGMKFQAEGFDGWRWSRGGNSDQSRAGSDPSPARSFWLVRANGWTLAGSGEGLAHLRSEYLAQLSQHRRPGAALTQSWLEADIDWPRLDHWLPQASLPFRPARTKITMTSRSEELRMAMQVIYPQDISWQGQPWRLPTAMVFDPLISFVAGDDIAPYLKPIPALEHLEANPLTNQFCLWALGEMPFQTYMAWPVDDASNTLQRLGAAVPAALNPELQKHHASEIVWVPKDPHLLWSKLQLVFPYLQVAPKQQGRYLLAGLFPLTTQKNPAPQDLWQQFNGRTNVVYYDWELSGMRLQQWRLLSQLLPILPPRKPFNPAFSKSLSLGKGRQLPTTIGENWLADLASMLGIRAETSTEITRTAPNELTVIRRSPMGLTSIEIVFLSHWLLGTGPGPIDAGLLPPRAKVSVPGAGH